MKATLPSKYQHVRAHLEEAIRNGEFPAGEQLPNEQALAERFGVSYLTARRAVCELVEADLLERRARKGTFVRARGTEIRTTTLSLITTTYDHAFAREFISLGSQLAVQQGWTPNVIRLNAGQQDAAVKAIRNGDLALCLLDEIPQNSSLAHAMRAARGKAICVGNPTKELGVPCLLVEPNAMFGMGVEYLRAAGHEDIFSVMQNNLETTYEIQCSAWRHAMSDRLTAEQANERIIEVRTPMFQCPTQDAYETVRRFLEQDGRPVTAFLSFGEEVTQGVLAACRDAGRSIPESISVVNLLDGPSMRYAHPAVTSVDVNFRRHFEVALQILQAAQAGEVPDRHLHFVEPRIVERESVNAR